MYNGIGVSTARGTGTSGYVQKNAFDLSARQKKSRGAWGTSAAAGAIASDTAPWSVSEEIHKHNAKREIELRLAELEDDLEEQGCAQNEIQTRLADERTRLQLVVERGGTLARQKGEDNDDDRTPHPRGGEAGPPANRRHNHRSQPHDDHRRKYDERRRNDDRRGRRGGRSRSRSPRRERERERRRSSPDEREYQKHDDDDLSGDSDGEDEERERRQREIERSERERQQVEVARKALEEDDEDEDGEVK